MYKRGYWKVLFMFLILVLAFFLAGCTLLGGAVVSAVSPGSSPGSIKAHTCLPEGCEYQMVEVLEKGKNSINCAFYDLRSPKIETLLMEGSKLIDVKLVVDDINYHKFRKWTAFPIIKDKSGGLMRNNFCIVDDRWVFTSSIPPVFNGINKDVGNIVIIDSVKAAENFETEFQEFIAGKFGGGLKTLAPTVEVGVTTIRTHFCGEDQCEDKVVRELRNAQESINIMASQFTSSTVADVLLEQNRKGIPIKVLFESRKTADALSKYRTFSDQKMGVSKLPNMMNNVFIIDEKVVITGSYEPTYWSHARNDENILIISSPEIAQFYMGEFNRLWPASE